MMGNLVFSPHFAFGVFWACRTDQLSPEPDMTEALLTGSQRCCGWMWMCLLSHREGSGYPICLQRKVIEGMGAYFLRLGRWTWVSSPELALSLRKCKAIAKIRPAMVTSGHGKAGGKGKELSSSWTEGRKEAFCDSWHVWDMKIKGRTFWPH